MLLVPPRKKSAGVDFPGALSRFLSNTHSPQEAANFAPAIKTLAELRAQALSATEVARCFPCASPSFCVSIGILRVHLQMACAAAGAVLYHSPVCEFLKPPLAHTELRAGQ